MNKVHTAQIEKLVNRKGFTIARYDTLPEHGCPGLIAYASADGSDLIAMSIPMSGETDDVCKELRKAVDTARAQRKTAEGKSLEEGYVEARKAKLNADKD